MGSPREVLLLVEIRKLVAVNAQSKQGVRKQDFKFVSFANLHDYFGELFAVSCRPYSPLLEAKNTTQRPNWSQSCGIHFRNLGIPHS